MAPAKKSLSCFCFCNSLSFSCSGGDDDDDGGAVSFLISCCSCARVGLDAWKPLGLEIIGDIISQMAIIVGKRI
jgi:hypothetical protein